MESRLLRRPAEALLSELAGSWHVRAEEIAEKACNGLSFFFGFVSLMFSVRYDPVWFRPRGRSSDRAIQYVAIEHKSHMLYISDASIQK